MSNLRAGVEASASAGPGEHRSDTGPSAQSSAMLNAMTVDVEDYFQVSAFERHIHRADWDRLPPRVELNTDRILELFDAHGARATFFTLGWVAQRFPGLLRRIVDQGHEVASHGFEHVRATEQTRQQFCDDVSRTKHLLEDVCGQAVRGFRAASFSIRADNLWALDVLQEVGYEYSSSVYPVRHDLYGMPDAPRSPFYHRDGGILEIPMSTIRLGGRNFPCSGGGYFRLLPYAYHRWAYRHLNRKETRPVIFYFHPWEIDPRQPLQRGIGLKTRVRHYLNLARMQPRLTRLLDEFCWGRMDDVFLERVDGSG